MEQIRMWFSPLLERPVIGSLHCLSQWEDRGKRRATTFGLPFLQFSNPVSLSQLQMAEYEVEVARQRRTDLRLWFRKAGAQKGLVAAGGVYWRQLYEGE